MVVVLIVMFVVVVIVCVGLGRRAAQEPKWTHIAPYVQEVTLWTILPESLKFIVPTKGDRSIDTPCVFDQQHSTQQCQWLFCPMGESVARKKQTVECLEQEHQI